MIPPALWNRLAEAPRIELLADRPARARYLVAAYGDIIRDRPALDAALQRLPIRPSRERLAAWRALADAGEFATLAEALMTLHYDPAYARSGKKQSRPLLGSVALDPTDPASFAAATDAVVARLARA
jgi:tRNA 2-selenouridine synthase